MAYYKLTESATLNKFVPEKINIWGGIGVEVVSILEKGDIIDVVKVDSTDYEKGMIKGQYYFTSEGNFVVRNDFFNPLTDQVSTEDLNNYALKKAKDAVIAPIKSIIDLVSPPKEPVIDAVEISKKVAEQNPIKAEDIITTYQGVNPIANSELIKKLPTPTFYQSNKNYLFILIGALAVYFAYKKFKK